MQSVSANETSEIHNHTSIPTARQTAGGRDTVLNVSVICPFFNEAPILEHSIVTLLARLRNLHVSSELIVVDDGSTDGGRTIVERLSEHHSELRLVSYTINRGRGYALRQGIARARGEVIITTEIDLSWGDDVVERLYEAMASQPDTDIVVASPHLPGGGYRNVPWKRVFLSRLGNRIIRTCMSNAVTMNTGMTRAYRHQVICALPLEEDRKEFHLEVVLKAQALGYRLSEIPCTLEWKSHKQRGREIGRRSSTRINRLVVSHMLFSLFANPIRYVWGLSAVSILCSLGFLIWGCVRFFSNLVSVYVLLIAMSFAIIALMFFIFGVIAQQGNMVQRELWTLKQDMRTLTRTLGEKGEYGSADQK